MGASTSSMGLVSKPPALPPAKQNNIASNNNMVKVSLNTPPDYKFQHFVKLCQKLQEEKKLIQVQIRLEVVAWQQRAKNGDEGVECKEKILGLLAKFRDVQQSQDNLIEKEKLRLDAFRNCINEDTTNRIKSRLEFFVQLNKQHETLLELVRQDVQDCKTICKKYQDSNLRSKGFETWIKCPGTPAYDYGSIGSL